MSSMTLLQYLLPVWTAYVLATASPGPSNMAIMGTAMERGRRSAFALVAGIVTGSMTWALLAATGLSAILATYANAMTLIRIVGGLYLLFLAHKAAQSAMTSSIAPSDVSGGAGSKGYAALYRNGLFLHLSNPKAIFTWISIMSLGVQPGMPAHVLPIMLGGSVLLSVTIFGGYALLFSSPPMVAIYRRARRWFEGAMAAFFAYAGLRLLLTRT
ncbi:LysE family translocator [Aureimonas altamirensis]|uniref:LysE family translocator n=1 Tax=Aureimonas altamirensis TaxID=370622 RepID=UPI001E356E97|nr:LysE family translocator [Aureimonas altamirensis]UHD45761.1 LysE family translocator [Aureimonas altamirensis]